MIFLKALRYGILSHCIDVFFDRVEVNFKKEEDVLRGLFKKTYNIYKRRMLNINGTYIGKFDDFYREQMIIFGGNSSRNNDLVFFARMQYTILRNKYPEYDY